MPEDLLLDWTPAPPVVGSVIRLETEVENFEALLRACVREVGLYFDYLKGSAAAFDRMWQRFARAVARGEVHAVQSTRIKALEGLEIRLDLLRRTHHLVVLLAGLSSEVMPDANVLLEDMAGLERLKADVFDRWKTVEDLEELAIEYYPLSACQLEALAASYPAPQTWYDEDHNPS